MKQQLIQALIWFYRLLIWLYPPRFREEFGEEMNAVFHQTLTTAPNNWLILAAGLRELRDWPANCWREHWYAHRSLAMVKTEPVIWINRHKRIWRTAILPLLIIALTGPWSFDLINVPAEYPCSLPNYRLEGDFCGIPFSLLWGIPVFFSSFFRIASGLLAGTTIPPDLSWGLLFSVSYLLLFLPFLTTWSLISRGSHQSRLAVVSWGLVIGVAYHFFGKSFLARPHPELSNIWLNRGVWLYIAIAIVALVLELIMFKAGSKAAPEITVSN